jgi:hypothetical protein
MGSRLLTPGDPDPATAMESLDHDLSLNRDDAKTATTDNRVPCLAAVSAAR